MKKLVSLILTVCILFSVLSIPASAVRYKNCAEALDKMGVFKGTATSWGDYDYELGRGAKRVEALVMLIRLIGKEKSALAYQSKQKFSDVPVDHWAHSYITYAYKKGYTSGVSSTEFAPDSEVTLNAYATFLLRALGYDDSKGDFSYDKAIEKAEKIGLLIKGTYKDGNVVCLRDDCVYMSLRALTTKMNGSKSTLADDLVSKGVIPKDSLSKALSTLKTADKEITNAQINNHPIKVTDLHTYTEYNSAGRVVGAVRRTAFYNYLGDYYFNYVYDENGRLTSNRRSNEATMSTQYLDFKYNSKGQLSDVSDYLIYIGDTDISEYQSYSLTYSQNNGKLLKIENEADSNDYMTFDYNGDTLTVETSRGCSFEYLDAIKPIIPLNQKTIVYKGSTYKYDSNNILKSVTDEYGNTTYSMKKNAYGAPHSEATNSYTDGGWGSDPSKRYLRESWEYKYSYNKNGSVASVNAIGIYNIWERSELVSSTKQNNKFTFTYLGNGKLDRILWKDNGVTYEQYATRFNDKGILVSDYYLRKTQ